MHVESVPVGSHVWLLQTWYCARSDGACGVPMSGFTGGDFTCEAAHGMKILHCCRNVDADCVKTTHARIAQMVNASVSRK